MASFQSKGDRRRALASSPPTVIQKGRSADNLEAILLKQTSHRAPELCFGFCHPFRNKPKYTLSPTFKPARGASQPRLARDWATASLCPSPLTLTKSASMPEFYGEGDQQQQPPPPAIVERHEWVCKGCKKGDAHRLVPNSDGGLTCVCGTVANLVDMVSLERAKNCHKDDDPTQVGEVQAPSTAQTAPWRDGPVSKEERNRRETAQLGGTRVSNPCARKNDMQQAQREVERQARKDAEELCRTDAPDQGRGQKLLGGLELVFAKMSSLRYDMPLVAAHIRLEAIRIYQLSVRHERKCCKKGCTYALSTRNMVVLTLGIIELVLSQLAGIEEGDGRLVEEITQGNNTRKNVERALTQLYQVQQDQNVGHQARTELLSAVHFISQWKPGKELFSCDASNFSTTHPNWQPAAQRSCPGEFGKSAVVDPGDTTTKLRESLKAIVRMRTVPIDTATNLTASYQLLVPAVMQCATLEGLPRDVVATAIVAASALKLKKDDPTSDLRRHWFRPLHIAMSTIDDFIARLVELIEIPSDLYTANKEEDEAKDQIPGFCT